MIEADETDEAGDSDEFQIIDKLLEIGFLVAIAVVACTAIACNSATESAIAKHAIERGMEQSSVPGSWGVYWVHPKK